MEFVAHLAAIRTEGERLAAVAELGLEAPVPSCPGWTVGDLVGHTGSVHRHKARIVAEDWRDRAPTPELPPQDDVIGWYRRGLADLLGTLAAHDPDEPRWTWHDEDQTVRFWGRRMACETLVHRIDAELAHGVVTDVDVELAADAADEILVVMMTGYPDWADLAFGDASVRLELTDAERSWTMRFARFSGTSPVSGTTYEDEPTFVLADIAAPATVVRGAAEDVALFLWGRRPADGLLVDGDPAMLDELRGVAYDVTQ